MIMGNSTDKKHFWKVPVLIGSGGIFLLILSAWCPSSIEQDTIDNMQVHLQKNNATLSELEAEKIKEVLQYWQDRHRLDHFLRALSKDVGVALLIAVGLLFMMELYARSRFFEEIRDRLLESYSKKLIPDAMWEELKNCLIGQDVIRKAYSVTLALKDEFNHKGRVSDTSVTYIATGIVKKKVDWKIELDLARGLTGLDDNNLQLPRFEQIEITDKNNKDKNVIYQRIDNSIDQFLSKDECKVSIPWEISGDDEICVTFKIREIIDIPGTTIYSILNFTEDMAIDVFNTEDLSISASALHSDPDRLTKTANGWKLPGGILPGQGIRVFIETNDSNT